MKHLLLECPFCGDPDPFEPTKGDPSGGRSDALYYIECSACTAEVFGSTPEQAVMGWNTRAAPKTTIEDDETESTHNSDNATVSDVLKIMSQMESEGFGHYVVTCNDEYILAKKGDRPILDHEAKTADLGGYD